MPTLAKPSPIKSHVNGIFVPVTDAHRARAWYRDTLELAVGDVLFGHLCCIPIGNDLSLLLDQKLTPDRAGAPVTRGTYPLFMFATDDIEASLAFLQAKGAAIVEYDGRSIQDGHWFNFKDCDGNLLMVCKPPGA